MNKLKQLWATLKGSLWFVPTLMVLCAIALAFILIEIDGAIEHDFQKDYPKIFGAGADGSRGMLSAIAGSMITVAGLTFSLTLVAMAQASSQYTSRILRNFMSDRRNQLVLGYFVGVFAYCLIVLRTIRGGDEGRFIPSLAVILGLLLAIASIGVLIFFIHHIARSIQAAVIIKTAADETIRAVQRLFPEPVGEEAREDEKEEIGGRVAASEWHEVAAPRNGYIQSVDARGLLRFAERNDCLVRMEHGIGDFVVSGAPLALFAAEKPGNDDERATELRALYTVGDHRTIEEDAAFGIRQIVDIALKALSPGVNDTTTAVICIDYLTAILVVLGARDLESLYRSHDGRVRIIARGATYASLVADAFDQIRASATGNAAVFLRMTAALETIGRRTATPSRLAVLDEQLDLLRADAERTLEGDYDLGRVGEKISETKAFLKTGLRGV